MTTLSTHGLALALAFVLPVEEGRGADYEAALVSALQRSLPGSISAHGPPPPGDEALFRDVLETDAFVSETVGPFDVHVSTIDGLTDRAGDVLDQVAVGLEPVAGIMERYFPYESGLISGQRFPIVVVDARMAAGDRSFDEVLALLDWCDRDWTGYVGANGTLWSDEQRLALTGRTWDALIINLAHETAVEHGDFFIEHGIGYQVIAHVVTKLLRQGSWGNVPPWMAQGLVDELDIEAYGQAWVGGDWFEETTEGWYRAGWSGFLPTGHSPPPAPSGPPADLATTVKNTGDSWAHRANSPDRHWVELAADRDSAAPASFAYQARSESFLPRDRAYARCVLHLMLEIAPNEQMGLFEPLDQVYATPASGMPDSHPLSAVVAEVLGGLPRVDRLEAMDMEALCSELGRTDIADRIRELGAEEVLAYGDHRDQAGWLYYQPDFDWAVRGELFNLFLEAEYYQQMLEWEVVGEALDQGAEAALRVSPGYPASGAARDAVAAAFRSSLPLR